MTVTEMSQHFGFVPQKQDGIPPPVNNACVPDIYNKLDADVIERTRVINSQLDMRLQVQEKVLGKYKTAAENRFLRERNRVRRDLCRIVRRLPNYSDIPQLETKIHTLKRKKRRSNITPRHNCVFTTEPLDMKGLADGKDDKPYCDRFFSHHLPTKSKFYKDVIPSVKEGMSVPDLRPRPSAGIQSVFPLRSQHVGGRINGKQLPVIHAIDDNFVASKSYHHLQDDDNKTV